MKIILLILSNTSNTKIIIAKAEEYRAWCFSLRQWGHNAYYNEIHFSLQIAKGSKLDNYIKTQLSLHGIIKMMLSD